VFWQKYKKIAEPVFFTEVGGLLNTVVGVWERWYCSTLKEVKRGGERGLFIPGEMVSSPLFYTQ